jgi:hypothetical protein
MKTQGDESWQAVLESSWLVGRLVVCLLGWLVGCLVGRLVIWSLSLRPPPPNNLSAADKLMAKNSGVLARKRHFYDEYYGVSLTMQHDE